MSRRREMPMTNPRPAATRAKLNTTARQEGLQSLSEEAGLMMNSCYLGDPSVTIIHRVDQPSFRTPRVARGDLVIADRRVKPVHGSLVIATINGEKFVRRLLMSGGHESLYAGGDSCEVIKVTEGSQVEILATIVSVIPVIPEPQVRK